MKEERGNRSGDKPVVVVIAAVIRGGRILLIRRRRGDYVNLWGLPGGKIERGEHIAEAAEREIAEETGITADFRRYCGLVSELLFEKGRLKRHFLLHVCELGSPTSCLKAGGEGSLGWFDIRRMSRMGKEIIPSDFFIIEKMILKKGKSYYECVMRKRGGPYYLELFD